MSAPEDLDRRLEEQRTLRAGGWAPLERDVVRVEGQEATTYLQGQLSQDVGDVPVGDAVWSLLLQPTGKVDAWLRATRWGEHAWLLDVDPGQGEAVAARLSRFLLRTAAEVVLDPGWDLRAVRGPAETTLDHPAEVPVLALPVHWRGLVGYDLLAPAGTPVALSLPEVGAGALEALRIECGVPAVGAELTEATIPAEAGQWLIDASVSFTKGCYTGQELVARIDSRGGSAPRSLCGVVVAAAADGPLPAVGSPVVVDGDEAGVLTSVARSAARDGAVALAMVRRAVQPPADAVVVVDGAEVPATVEALPLSR